MKKLVVSLMLFSTLALNAQYCIFYDFEAKNPEMVVSTLKGMMETGWGKNIQGTKSLFAYQFNGTNQATHSIQFCFPDEKALGAFFNSFGTSIEAQLFGEKLGKYIQNVSQTLNTPIWYNGQYWANDDAFVFYKMQVSDPATYLAEFKSFTPKLAKKLGFENNSFGLAYPIVGKSAEFSHFVWVGAPDLETALTRTKQMMSDPLFADFSKKVSVIRKMITTTLFLRVMDF